jgi:hypothetical protein
MHKPKKTILGRCLRKKEAGQNESGILVEYVNLKNKLGIRTSNKPKC